MENGRLVPDTYDEILSVLMDNAKDVFGEDLNDDDEAVIRLFYKPVARLLAESQSNLKTVLDSAQLEYAEGKALDLLTALIGVRRKSATKSVGSATFSRQTAASVDYTIPKGTKIQTDSIDPIKFETTETAILQAGTNDVSVPIQSVTTGV